MKKIILSLSCCGVFLLVCLSGGMAQPFIHPGLLQSQEDFARMKQGIAAKAQPLFEGFQVFRNHPQSQYDYKMQGPMAMVGRNPTVGQSIYDADANAAYQNAVMWAVTGDNRYADKAKEIVNAWSETLKSITGKDAVLMAGLGPFKMVNAAEILRYSNCGWSAREIALTEHHFRQVIYPVIKDFAPFANGNWDAAALKTMMAIAIFCNDRPMFEKALVYYQHGAGDGSLPNYIINDEGQCQESGRDQSHTQLGIAHLADCSEIAWHQGLDLYSILDYRLLKGFEYTAQYNLSMDVPYIPAMDRTGKYLHPKISEEGRGRLRAVYEEVYNHYVNRIGRAAPYTQQAAGKVRPELQGLPGADHVGFGTFLYSIPEKGSTSLRMDKQLPAAPAGIDAVYSNGRIKLSWVPVKKATSYIIKRSDGKNGRYKIIARGVSSSTFSDKQVKRGSLYRYTVSAVNQSGTGENSYPVNIYSGLPAGWISENIGNANITGTVKYDGEKLIIDGAGMGLATDDDYLFVNHAVGKDVEIIVRYVPQLTSQFTGFGLAFRSSKGGKAASFSLLVRPKATDHIEAPGWVVQSVSRQNGGDSLKVLATSSNLDSPVVTNSRMTGYCWLKVQKHGSHFTGFYSADGKTWLDSGSADVLMDKNAYGGIFVYSELKGVTTTVTFDHLTPFK